MTTETSIIIDSLEEYVLDIKPYHSKLSDIIVEYEFFDDVPVKITDEHSIKMLMNSIWSSDFISGPAGIISKYELRAQFSAPTFFSCLNNFRGTDFNSGIFSSLNYKMFSKHFRKETKLVRKNNVPQLEGHDYFQTKGAYSFDILPDQKIIQTSHNTTSINWNDPDYQFSDGITRQYDIFNIEDAKPTYHSTYEYNLGVLTAQVNSSFSDFKNFEVKFKSNNDGIIELALHYAPIDGGAEIVRFDANDAITCLSGSLTLSYSVTSKTNFDIPVDTVLGSFNITPKIKNVGNTQIKLNLPNGFNSIVNNDQLLIVRDTVKTEDLPELTAKIEFGNNVKKFHRWKFVVTDKFIDGTPTDKLVFNVFISELSPTDWMPMGVQAFDGILFSSSVLYNNGLEDLDVIDFTLTKKPDQHVAIGQEFIFDSDVIANSLGYKLFNLDSGTPNIEISSASIDSNFDAVLVYGPYLIELLSETLEGTFSSIEIPLKLSDLINQTKIIPSTLFAVDYVTDVNTLDEIRMNIRSFGTNPIFNVYAGDLFIGAANNYFNFNSQFIKFRPRVTQLFSNAVNLLNYSNFELVIRPKQRIIVSNNANQETWSLVKINPVSYSRPRMRIANVAELEISDLWAGTPSQEWIANTINATTFELTGSVSGIATTNISIGSGPTQIYADGKYQFTAELFPATGSSPYQPQTGDFYSFEIFNEVASTPQFNLVFGYDLVEYDAPYYDTRFQYYDVNQLNFTMAPDIPNSIMELRALNSTTFSVKMFNKEQYLIGNQIELVSMADAIVDVPYSNQYVSFTIVHPTHVSDPTEFVENDLFFINIENPDPYVSDGPFFSSPNMPFVHMYGTSYVDLDPKRWTFTAVGNEFTAASVPASSFVSPNVEFNKAYDNSEVHFTFYPSLTIAISPGDSFYFDIFEEQPSYKVFGSLSGEQKMATLGKWYNNGSIAFVLEKPHVEVLSSYGTLDKRRVIVNSDVFPMTVKLDNSNRAIKFDRAPRSDSMFDVYTFKYLDYSNTFAVNSKTGNKLGVDFNTDYEWCDRLNNSVLSQNMSFDVKHADFNLALTVKQTDTNNGPISFTPNYTFNVEIKDHGFPLYHSFNGILFSSIQNSDLIFVEDLSEDKFAMQIYSTSLSIPDFNGTPVTKYLESADNAQNLLDSSNQIIDNRVNLWGMENIKLDGNKFNEIALIPVRQQEYADVGIIDVDLYSANIPNLKIGKIRQKESLLRPIIQFEQSFVNSYFGTQGAKFALKVEQGQLLNTITATKITESIKFAEKINFNDDSNSVNVSISDELSFNSIWIGFRFYDNINASVKDSTISNLYNYGGYDTLEYDNETNDLNEQLGGPNDIDNDGIIDTSDVYTSQESKYDFGLKYAEQGLGIFGDEVIKEPADQDIKPKIQETFVMYSINLPTNFDDVLFDETILDSDASADAMVQMNQKQDASIDNTHPLFGKTYWNGVANVPFANVSYTNTIGENVLYSGSIQDIKITNAIVNHPFGTNITKIIVVDNLSLLNEVAADIEIINNNSFKVTPTVPRTFAVIVV